METEIDYNKDFKEEQDKIYRYVRENKKYFKTYDIVWAFFSGCIARYVSNKNKKLNIVFAEKLGCRRSGLTSKIIIQIMNKCHSYIIMHCQSVFDKNKMLEIKCYSYIRSVCGCEGVTDIVNQDITIAYFHGYYALDSVFKYIK